MHILLFPFVILYAIWAKRQTALEWAKFNSGLAPTQGEGPQGLPWTPATARDEKGWRRRLKHSADGSARIAPRWTALVLVNCFGLFALAMMGAAIDLFIHLDKNDLWVGGLFLVVPISLSIAWLFKIRAALDGVRFDWQGRVCRRLVFESRDRLVNVSFDQVAGLQLLPRWNDEQNRGSSSSYLPGYVTWQLNLVLNDHSRCTLMAHGNGPALEADAQALAQLLRVPLWRGMAQAAVVA